MFAKLYPAVRSPYQPMPRARTTPKPAPRDNSSAELSALPPDELNPRAAYLDTLPPGDVVKLLVDEELKAVRAVKARAQLIAEGAALIADRLATGGRLIYVGAGTSGRLGTLDAAESIPTFGVPPSLLIPIIAGGTRALTKSMDGPEADPREAEQRMKRAAVGPDDVVCCVAANGIPKFVQAALEYAHLRKAATLFVTCGRTVRYEDGSSIADVVIEMASGPEVIAGANRLKAGTATKVALSALSTTTFVLLGKTYGGLMVDVRPTNNTQWARAGRIVMTLSKLSEGDAFKLLKKAGGRAKVALVMHHQRVSAVRARELIIEHRGSLRAIVGDIDLGA